MANIIGLITVNSKQVLEVDAVPSGGAGTAAPKGSLAMYDSGTVGSVYIKAGAADTAWVEIDTPENADWKLDGNTVGAEADLGTLDNFDLPFIRNSIEEMRLAAGGLLVGLNASIGGRLQLAAASAGSDIFKEALSPASNPVIHVTRMFRILTTDATPGTFNILIPEDYNAKVEANVIVRQTGGATGAAGDGASYQRTIHARNLADSVTVFQQQSDYTYEVVNQLNFGLSGSGANVVGTVTGVADRDLSWGIHVDLLMITT